MPALTTQQKKLIDDFINEQLNTLSRRGSVVKAVRSDDTEGQDSQASVKVNPIESFKEFVQKTLNEMKNKEISEQDLSSAMDSISERATQEGLKLEPNQKQQLLNLVKLVANLFIKLLTFGKKPEFFQKAQPANYEEEFRQKVVNLQNSLKINAEVVEEQKMDDNSPKEENQPVPSGTQLP